MGQDVKEAAQSVLDERMEREIEDFMEWHESGHRMRRGVRRGGERTEVWSSNSYLDVH